MFERSIQGAVNIIHTSESFSGDALDSYQELVDEIVDDGKPMIVFDLSEVPLINGKGIELLLASQEQCLSRGGNLRLAAASSTTAEILRITKVDQKFEVFGKVSSAVGSFVR